MTCSEPPYYILVSHSPLSTNTPGVLSNALGHPQIQYHYADDSPLALLPQTPNEHVLVLDYDPTIPTSPTAKSMSRNMVVTSVKVAEAPGAAADEDELKKNDKMYILETTTASDDNSNLEVSQRERLAPEVILAQFKQRNAILRRALLFPDAPTKGQPPVQR